MVLKEVIEKTAVLLGLEDVITDIEENRFDGEDVKLLVRCANLVISEIAYEYMPLIVKEELTADSVSVMYKDLAKPIIDIVNVMMGGVQVRAKQFSNYFVLPRRGSYEVEYSYAPSEINITDVVELPAKVSDRVVAYGVACEYSLINGMNDEAVMWDRRFREAASSLNKNRQNIVIKKRKWY